MSTTSRLFQEIRQTLVLAVPLMASQVAQMMMGLVDSAMVGQVGVIPLAASAFANGLLSPPMLIGIGLMAALSVRISQAHGAGRAAQTGELLRNGLFLALLSGAVLAAAVWGLSFHLHRFGQTPEVASAARNYLVIMGISLIPMLAGMALKQFSDALNHPWPPTLIQLASVPLNAFLNWILIYGNLGAPAMGLEGAALSTLLARCIATLATWIYITAARRFDGAKPAYWLGLPSWPQLVSLMKIGGPSAITLVLEASAFSIAALAIGWFGAIPLAAHQIAMSCASTTFMLPLGVSLATTIRIGQAVGASDHARLRFIGVSSMTLGITIMAVCGLVLALFRIPIARVFVQDAAVIAAASPLLIAAAVFQMFDGLQVVAGGALRGLADLHRPVIICITAYWLIFLPLAYFMAFTCGLQQVGVWTSLIFALAAAALLLARRFMFLTR